jgi:hypothetical protein
VISITQRVILDDPLCKIVIIKIRKAKIFKKLGTVGRVIPEAPDGYIDEIGPWADGAPLEWPAPMTIWSFSISTAILGHRAVVAVCILLE